LQAKAPVQFLLQFAIDDDLSEAQCGPGGIKAPLLVTVDSNEELNAAMAIISDQIC